MGASVASVTRLISKEFLWLVGLGLVIAAPIGYFGMRRWLESFAYRIEVGPGIFLLAGLVVLLTALGAVSYQAVRAALADPVRSLRYE
jgi:putative ABC transport system permease protein